MTTRHRACHTYLDRGLYTERVRQIWHLLRWGKSPPSHAQCAQMLKRGSPGSAGTVGLATSSLSSMARPHTKKKKESSQQPLAASIEYYLVTEKHGIRMNHESSWVCRMVVADGLMRAKVVAPRYQPSSRKTRRNHQP